MKHSEHLVAAAKHRTRLHTEAAKPFGKQDFPEEEDWHHVQVILTCHTPGCVADGLHNLTRCADNADGLFRAHCGHCQQEIHDIVGVFSDGNVRLEHFDSAKHAPKRG